MTLNLRFRLAWQGGIAQGLASHIQFMPAKHYVPPKVSLVDHNLYQKLRYHRYKFHTFPLNPTYFPGPSSGNEGYLANDPYTVRGVSQPGAADNEESVNQYLASQSLMSNTVNYIHHHSSRACSNKFLVQGIGETNHV